MQRVTLKQELLAEFLGTFVLLAFGAGVVAQTVLSDGKSGGQFSINIAWGIAVTLAIYVAGGVSGAHLNPAVTVALAARRGFPWTKVIPYCAAQIAGAFVASATVFLVYYEAFKNYDGGLRAVTGAKATAGIFATYPQPFLSTWGGLIDQIAGTALLLMLILAITDARNNAPTGNTAPVIIGLLIVAIGMGFGFNAGYAINPARDFGPRLFTFVAGWGSEVFSASNHYFWVPIVGPLIGGVAGAYIYDLFIGSHLSVTAEERATKAAAGK